MKKISIAFLSTTLLCLGGSVQAASWHYDFDGGEDVSQLAFTNLVPPPSTGPTYTLNGNLEIAVPGNAAYDLCSWVNNNAPRVYRNVTAEAFALETKMSTVSTTYTFLSGLFLYNSADGVSSNDLVYGASPTSLKIDLGNPTAHTGPYAWTPIGGYSDLYLQVVHDGAGNYDFNYKLAAGDPWILHAELSGYTFDYLGVITKTWHNPAAGYPAVTADFDYLNYNYEVPLPGAVWLLGAGLAGLAGLKGRRRTGSSR